MEYKRFGNKIIVRIDKDEEILEQVKELALKENIRLAAVCRRWVLPTALRWAYTMWLRSNTTPTPSAAALRLCP